MKELTLLFLEKEDQILLAMKKRGFGEGKWNGVGGKLDAGETVEQALIRESQEEIGVTPTTYSQVAKITFHEYENGEAKDMLVHVFRYTSWKGEPTESDEMRPRWFIKSEIPYDSMWSDDIYWLPEVLKGNLIVGSFTLNNEDAIESYDLKHVSEFE